MSHIKNEEEARQKRSLAKKIQIAEKSARKEAIKNRPRFKGLQILPTASIFDDADKKEPGQDNWVGKGFDIHPQVTFISSAALITFIILTLMFKSEASRITDLLMGLMTRNAG